MFQTPIGAGRRQDSQLGKATPLHYQAVPADLEPTDFIGRIGFPENPRHPAFAGLSRRLDYLESLQAKLRDIGRAP